jgi:hypothetical protein
MNEGLDKSLLVWIHQKSIFTLLPVVAVRLGPFDGWTAEDAFVETSQAVATSGARQIRGCVGCVASCEGRWLSTTAQRQSGVETEFMRMSENAATISHATLATMIAEAG